MASCGKLASGTFDTRRADLAMQLAGPVAVAWDDPTSAGTNTATALLNSRFISIAGGTNEILEWHTRRSHP